MVEAPNAEKAIESIAASGANILISDIAWRRGCYQLLRRLRALGYGPDVLPAIALTAFARTEDRSAALAAGFPGLSGQAVGSHHAGSAGGLAAQGRLGLTPRSGSLRYSRTSAAACAMTDA